MKIFISLIILGSLAFLITKFGAKKTIEEIEDKASEAAAALKYAASSDSNSNTDSQPKQVTTQLEKDKASLAALQNDAGNKDLLRRIGILQGQNKWGVKDENGFYYSVDSTGVVFSGSNSTDEYDTMLQQQTDYNTKVAALTKSITGETPAESKPVDEGMGGVNGLEIPLEIKLLISAIKSKFNLESVDEDEDNGNDNSNTDNDDADYHSNYNGGNNGGNDNGGGGGGSNNNNPYPFANTVLPSAVVTAPLASIIPTGQTLANILSQPITMGTLHPRINLSPFNITPTPTPTPVPNSNPVVANTQMSSERQAQPTSTSQRHSGHHYHNHRRH